MNWLLPYFILNMAFLPLQSPDTVTILKNQFESHVVIGAQMFNHLNIEGSFNTHMKMIRIDAFAPYQEEYKIKAFLTYGPIEIGAEHLCAHPVTSLYEGYQREGAYRKIYIEFDSRGLNGNNR